MPWQRRWQQHAHGPEAWRRGDWEERWSPGWSHGPGPWPRRPGFLFLRLIVTFGVIALLVLGGMMAIALLLTRLFGGDGQVAVLVWIGGCGLALALPLLAATLAVFAFRGIATPLADVMSAADAVAGGDLSVRIPERGRRDFARLAHSFNRMTEELARAEQQRRNMTADVAHELRTPLHILQGNLEGILDGVYEPTDAHINATLDEARILSRLVEDLRTLSLAEAGALPLAWEPVEVMALLADAQTSFSGQAEAAGVNLQITPDLQAGAAANRDPAAEIGPMTLMADIDRLNQVLGNLLANALRHTPAGGTIVLAAQPLPQGVRIIVSDTGDGIPAEDLPFVFDRFWRGDRSRSHAEGAGSGLGLAITRQLVQAHGGQIRVESAPGQGTTFTIDLPARPDAFPG